jgi:hypothetical protein
MPQMKRISQMVVAAAMAAMALPATQAQWNPLNPIRDVKRDTDGLVLSMDTGTLRIRAIPELIVARDVFSDGHPAGTDAVYGDKNILACCALDHGIERQKHRIVHRQT